MVCLVKNRSKFYKKTLLDIWGYHKLYKRPSKLINYIRVMSKERKLRRKYYRREFVYSLQKKIRFRWRKKFKSKYINHRYLYNFYMIVRRRTFRKYMYKARRRRGSFIGNYLIFLEGRLFMLVYRSNFVNNIFKLKYIIDRGIFLVDNEIKYYSNHVVKPGQLVQVSFDYRDLLKKDFKLRLKQGYILWMPRKYIFVNYSFMFIFFLRPPKKRELKFPIKFDIYLGGDLYFL